MKPWLISALLLLAAPAAGQDTVAVVRDLTALRAKGVRAEIRSKTTKRNPETGRSMTDVVEAYTKGVIADARGDLVFFVAEDDDQAWIRTNSVALLERADRLIALLEEEGVEAPALRALNEKWFPAEPATDDPASLIARERVMKQMGMPVSIGLFTFEVDEAGGVRPSIAVKNLSEETVERLTLEMIAFSDRGDVVRDRTTGLATQVATLEAVMRPGDTAVFSYSDAPLWVNRLTSCIELRKIEVFFQGGTSHAIDYQLAEVRPLPSTFHVMGECTRPGS